MNEVTLAHSLNMSLVLVLILSAPPLIVAAIVGLTVGLMQAVTQIQDQSLPLVFKTIAIMVCLVVFGPMLVAPLIEFTDQIFKDFATIVR